MFFVLGTGFASFAIANNSYRLLYKPIVVTYGVKLPERESVLYVEPMSSKSVTRCPDKATADDDMFGT